MRWRRFRFISSKAQALRCLFLAHYYADRAEFHKRYAALFQSVRDNSGKGKFTTLDLLGNLAAYFIFGEQEKNEKLAARIGHEEAVIDALNPGMSRVDAEQKVYDDERLEKIKDSIEKEDPCSFGSGSSYPATREYQSLISAEQENKARTYRQCEEAAQAKEARAAALAADYLKCVKTYVDSNAIEQHCKYFN
jgi:hypothetical protein